MSFPRIKEFIFDMSKVYTVPSNLVGRLDLIAFELFDDVKFYKPIAAANNIRIHNGYRPGLRTVEQALRIELKNDGYSDDEIETLVYEKMVNKRSNSLDWYDYATFSYGYISQVTEGKVLRIPTFESAIKWLSRFEFIDGN